MLLEVDSDRCVAETVKILCFTVTVFVELPVKWGLGYFTMDMCKGVQIDQNLHSSVWLQQN
jgi:hypothetical protein